MPDSKKGSRARRAAPSGASALSGASAPRAAAPPLQTALVLQGGGALGAYQVGVMMALQEAGIEPDWVIGTSIGAINAALIAGNARERRIEAMQAFWDGLRWRSPLAALPFEAGALNPFANLSVLAGGVPGFFAPNPASWLGPHWPAPVHQAAYYGTDALAGTLKRHASFERIARGPMRLTVGAVHVTSGRMRYFDSREETLDERHVMASGALPPGFPAVRIDGEPYWDGGIYSNTPIEAVLDDRPRRSTLIFTVQLWNPEGDEPGSIWQVLGRQKDIQYASRADSHIARQKQIHRLRHVISELAQRLPAAERESARGKELASWGCRTTMHIVRLMAPRLQAEDHTKDIDFTPAGIRARIEAGLADGRHAIAQKPWDCEVDPLEGVLVHEHSSMAKTMR